VLDPRLFTPLPPALRATLDADYLAFVRERDGEPDLRRRTLARREEWFTAMAARPAPEWAGEILDRERFGAWHRGEGALREASRLTVWLVEIARANEGEGWGVDYLLERGGFQGLGRHGGLRPRDFADLEETYHTRIFREIVRLFGLDFQLRDPPKVIQQSVKIMARLPERLSFTLLAAGEIMGTVAFLRQAENGARLFADHPAMGDRIRELLDEILVDEIGHVTYLLGSMSAWQLAIVRQVAHGYLASTQRGYPDRRRDVVEAIRHGIANYSLGLFPTRVLRRAFVPSPYWPVEVAR